MAKTIAPPKYLHVVCLDTVWVLALMNVLNKKFGRGQVVNKYDAYMDQNMSGQLQFHLNRETIPMEQIAALIGSTPDFLAEQGTITLKPLPFEEGLPEPNSVWGTA